MEKLHELASKPSSPPPQSASSRPHSWLARDWDLLALVLLVLASFPVEWLSRRMLFLNGAPNLIDDSWILDTSFKASRGLWFGRDVAFTYGPLFQWLSSAPARSMGLSMGAIYPTYFTLTLWCTFLFGYLTIRLLLPEQPVWKRCLLLLLLSIFWVPWEGRIAFATFLFALFLKGWYELRRQSLNPVLLGCGAALLCTAAFLYSADTGAYAMAGLLLSLAGVAWESRRESGALRSYASGLLAFAGFSLLLVIAVNAVMAKPFDFRFWQNSLAILAGYRWIEPMSMSKAGKIRLFVAFLTALVVFLMRGASGRNPALGITARSGFLLSAFAFAFITMQSGLVRSDWGHIGVCTYATIFLAGVVLFSFASRTASAFAVLLAVAASLLSGQDSLVLSVVQHNYAQLRDPLTQCPLGFREFDRVCYPGEFTRILQTTGAYLRQGSGPDDFIMVFPYESVFGIASRRNVAGGVMQSYLVSGTYLSRVDIVGLERAAAPTGLYLSDGDQSKLIDGVPNLTRSSEIWFWAFRHYRKEQELYHGIFALQRDDSRAARISMLPQSLSVAARSYPIRTRRSQLDLGDPGWPSGADFLRLRLTVRYSFWWKLRKPALIMLEIERTDGSDVLVPFIVEPNVASEVWFYPWDDVELSQYFAADETDWRIGPRPAITHLRLVVRPLDWISVQPDMIEVQSADAVRFGMNP